MEILELSKLRLRKGRSLGYLFQINSIYCKVTIVNKTVPGRMITDNILLAFEHFHYMKKRKRNGGKDYTALKLDMSKTYDRIEWVFLEQMLIKLGFHKSWVRFIMKCHLRLLLYLSEWVAYKFFYPF